MRRQLSQPQRFCERHPDGERALEQRVRDPRARTAARRSSGASISTRSRVRVATRGFYAAARACENPPHARHGDPAQRLPVPARARAQQRPRLVQREQGRAISRSCATRCCASSRRSRRSSRRSTGTWSPTRARPGARCSGSTATPASPGTRARTRPTPASTSRRPAGASHARPGFYLHVEPGSVFMGAGIWRPEPDALKQIRDAIAAKPAAWKKASRRRRSARRRREARAPAARLRPRASRWSRT